MRVPEDRQLERRVMDKVHCVTDLRIPVVADVIGVLEQMYDPAWARDWDAVGMVCGDPQAPVRRVLLAVDPVASVVDEALGWHADLLRHATTRCSCGEFTGCRRRPPRGGSCTS